MTGKSSLFAFPITVIVPLPVLKSSHATTASPLYLKLAIATVPEGHASAEGLEVLSAIVQTAKMFILFDRLNSIFDRSSQLDKTDVEGAHIYPENVV